MGTITGLSKAQMDALTAAYIVSGAVVGGNLHLTTEGGTVIDAGPVTGPQGVQGIQGIPGIMGGTSAQRDAYFGTPAVLADQVTLANKAPLWYNVTSGNLETYYVPSGSAGLTVPGFYTVPGWYKRDVKTREPLGLVAFVETYSPGGAGTALAIQQNIPSFTFLANRWYEIEWAAAVVYTSGTGTTLAQIWSCSTADAASATTGLTELMGFNLDFRNASQTVRANPKRRIKYSIDTTLQIKASINGNGSSIYAAAGATWPNQLMIKDQGMQF